MYVYAEHGRDLAVLKQLSTMIENVQRMNNLNDILSTNEAYEPNIVVLGEQMKERKLEETSKLFKMHPTIEISP